MTKFIKTVLVSGALCLISTANAIAADLNVSGIWLTEDGSARVEIADCGDGSPCGLIIWVDPNGEGSMSDDNNPDPVLKGQNIIGSKMLWGFKAKKEKWSKGRIYDARDGKTYKSKLKLGDDGTLVVKGCVGPFCKSQNWTRVKPTA